MGAETVEVVRPARRVGGRAHVNVDTPQGREGIQRKTWRRSRQKHKRRRTRNVKEEENDARERSCGELSTRRCSSEIFLQKDYS